MAWVEITEVFGIWDLIVIVDTVAGKVWALELQKTMFKTHNSESLTTVTLCKWTANMQDIHHRGTEQILWSVDEMANSAINKTGNIYVLLGPFIFKEMETTSWLVWHYTALISIYSVEPVCVLGQT